MNPLIKLHINEMSAYEKHTCIKQLNDLGWVYDGESGPVTNEYGFTATKISFIWNKDSDPVIPEEFSNFIT